jgi:MerR family transcriptional regulator, aldehyde-responsive regulator
MLNQTNILAGKKYFKAQEVARMLGISKQTLFRYEKKGILPKAERNFINKWRQYSEEEVEKLRLIIRGGGE